MASCSECGEKVGLVASVRVLPALAKVKRTVALLRAEQGRRSEKDYKLDSLLQSGENTEQVMHRLAHNPKQFFDWEGQYAGWLVESQRYLSRGD